MYANSHCTSICNSAKLNRKNLQTPKSGNNHGIPSMVADWPVFSFTLRRWSSFGWTCDSCPLIFYITRDATRGTKYMFHRWTGTQINKIRLLSRGVTHHTVCPCERRIRYYRIFKRRLRDSIRNHRLYNTLSIICNFICRYAYLPTVRVCLDCASIWSIVEQATTQRTHKCVLSRCVASSFRTSNILA